MKPSHVRPGDGCRRRQARAVRVWAIGLLFSLSLLAVGFLIGFFGVPW